MKETILFLILFSLSSTGLYLIVKKSGNHDVDFIIKLVGWILFIPSILGLLQSLKIL